MTDIVVDDRVVGSLSVGSVIRVSSTVLVGGRKRQVSRDLVVTDFKVVLSEDESYEVIFTKPKMDDGE